MCAGAEHVFDPLLVPKSTSERFGGPMGRIYRQKVIARRALRDMDRFATLKPSDGFAS